MSNYTAEQLERRNRSKWTKVQAILAPIQFLVFLVSLTLVVRYLITGHGYMIANLSVLIKIGLLWIITITGMFWEKEMFGHWFLAPEFFWEDVGNAVALFFHNLYFVALWLGWSHRSIMWLMLVAYTTYLINCAQFLARGYQTHRQRTAAQTERLSS
jgi:3-vinyl bacteriochlorophyllide hydratase